MACWLAPYDPLLGDLQGGRGVISQSVAVTIDVLLGLLAGCYQRWGDATVMRLADVTLAPGIAIGTAVFGFNLVGDVLRDAFDSKASTQQ